MAEIKLTAGSVPDQTPYPGTFRDFLKELSAYLTVQYPDELRYAVVSSSTPTGSDQNKLWYQLDSSTGAPKNVKIFYNGNWVEFSPFVFGDMVLVPDAAQVVSPWGNGLTTYTVSGQKVVAPQTPSAPSGYKYKVYVGNYT